MAALNGFVVSEYTLLEMESCDWEYLTIHYVACLKTLHAMSTFPFQIEEKVPNSGVSTSKV